jgi:glycolate oxidase iron-sulfur subunit
MADHGTFPLPEAERIRLDGLLRRCIQCGLCLPACATWVATGDETMSPRGRLLLLGELLADPVVSTCEPSVRAALDTCIGCQACSAVCPSGVPFDLLEAAVAAARTPSVSQAVVPPLAAPSVPAALLRRLDDPRWLRAIGWGSGRGRDLLRLLLGPRWRLRAQGRRFWGPLARLAGTVPRAPCSDRALAAQLDGLLAGPPTPPGRLGRPAEPRETVIWFAGCANEGLLPDSSRRLRELLTWAGAGLREPAGTTCCGALAAHAGRPEQEAAQREHNLAAWQPGDPAAAIVTEAAGCGVAVRGYGDRLPAPQVDAIVWLAGTERPAFGAVPLKVALHDPCHARHAQGIVKEPRALLRAIPGLTLLEPDEPDVCCGSGGLWSLSHGDLSARLGARKARLLAETGADLVVTANPGCLGQIADGLAVLPGNGPPVLPLGDLLWYAALRGRKP